MSKQVTKSHVRDAVHMHNVNWGARLTLWRLQIHRKKRIYVTSILSLGFECAQSHSYCLILTDVL